MFYFIGLAAGKKEPIIMEHLFSLVLFLTPHIFLNVNLLIFFFKHHLPYDETWTNFL
jgi:hypothetical protein